MRYVGAVEDTKRVAVETIKLRAGKMSSIGQLAKAASDGADCKSLNLMAD